MNSHILAVVFLFMTGCATHVERNENVAEAAFKAPPNDRERARKVLALFYAKIDALTPEERLKYASVKWKIDEARFEQKPYGAWALSVTSLEIYLAIAELLEEVDE